MLVSRLVRDMRVPEFFKTKRHLAEYAKAIRENVLRKLKMKRHLTVNLAPPEPVNRDPKNLCQR